MDEQNIGKDRTLGHYELPAADYIKEGRPGEYLVHDETKPVSQKLRIVPNGPTKGVLNFTVSFYPTIPVVNPDEEAREAKEAKDAAQGEVPGSPSRPGGHSRSESKTSTQSRTASWGSTADADVKANKEQAKEGQVDKETSDQPPAAEEEQAAMGEPETPKIRLTADNLAKYGTLVASLGFLDSTN
jgi:hypothetical protein